MIIQTKKEHIELTAIKLKTSAIKDLKSVVNSIYRMNEPYSFGYVFNLNSSTNPKLDKTYIFSGMFVSRTSELDSTWEYFYNFKDSKTYLIAVARPLEGEKENA